MFTGCASTLPVRAVQPGRVNFGAAKQLVVVQSEGRRSAREELIAELQKQARSQGYWTATDRSEDGITMRAAGRTVNVVGAKEPQTPDQVWVRVDVLEWTAQRDSRMEPIYGKNDKGERIKTGEKEVKFMKGKVLLAFTAANAKGRALLAESEYEATAEAETEAEARIAAGRNAVAKFLFDVTPTTVTRHVRLDDSDKGQESILKLAKDGQIHAAAQEMQRYLQSSPNNAAAQYNLAVLLDASGNYQDALDLLNQAMRNAPKDYYGDMKQTVAKHLADAEAMSE